MITAPPITLVIPGPPVGKGRARVVRTKAGFPIAFTPDKTRNYEATIREAFRTEYPGFEPLEGPLSLDIRAYFQIPVSASRKARAQMVAGILYPTKKPDWSNIAKCEDALNGLAFRDDSQVVAATVLKLYSLRPRLEIRISKVTP